jgi:hypothetical protein
MSRVLSNAMKHAMYSQETDEVFIVLLTISHPTFAEDIKVCSDAFQMLPNAGVRGVVSRGEEYIYLPFSIELPQQNETGLSRAKLSVDNIDRRVVDAVRRADSSLSIKLEIVLASDVNTPEISIDKFKLSVVNYDSLTVSGDLTLEYFDLEPFPYGRFTPSLFPGLF